MTRARLFLVGGVVFVALAFIPRPRNQVTICGSIPWAAICDLVLAPFAGPGDRAGDVGPAESPPTPDTAPPPDAATAPGGEDVDQVEPAEQPRGARVAARPRPAATAPGRVLLRVGEQALQSRWFTTAYRRCKEAAEIPGDHRPEALLCQGRAAIGLRWAMRAAYLAERALELRPDSVAALVLLGDAQGDCRQARPLYLRALELRAGDVGALAGLARCSVDLPGPAPDLATGPPPPASAPACAIAELSRASLPGYLGHVMRDASDGGSRIQAAPLRRRLRAL